MTIQETVAVTVTSLALTWMTIEDIRHKKISLAVLAVLGTVLLAISVWQKNGLLYILLGLLPGVLAMFFSWLTKGGFGLGDALLLIATGSFLGLWDGLAVLMMGLILSSLTGIVLLAMKKAKLKTELPFIPFYFGGLLIWGINRWIL